MSEYKTKSGDMFDLIAYKELGDCLKVGALLKANKEHLQTFEFKAGVLLDVPEVKTVESTNLPPWRR